MAAIPENWGDETDIVDSMKHISIGIYLQRVSRRQELHKSKVTAYKLARVSLCAALRTARVVLCINI